MRIRLTSPDQQIAMACAALEKAHSGHGNECINALAVNWIKVPYSLGPWPVRNPAKKGHQEGPYDTPAFRLLCQPEGRLVFASAALSQTPRWQEGGIQSAHAAVDALAKQVGTRALTGLNLKMRGKMDFAGFNAAYKAFYGTSENLNLVARSTVQVAGLASPNFLAEIEAVAAKAPSSK